MSKEEKVPFETIVFSGVTFKVINRHEAHEIIGDLTDFKDQKIYNVFEDTWRFPNYEENPIFLLAEEDVEMDSFEMDFSTEEHSDIFILGFIFKGNLNVAKLISSYDTDNSPALIVLGKTTTVNINLFGSVHYLGGGLQCDTLAGEYNHGELFVKGDLTAWLVYSDDMLFHFERFTDVQAIISNNRPDILICSNVQDTDGSIITVENYLPSTHKLSDIVEDSFFENSDYNEEILGNNYLEIFKEGLSILDYDKKDKYMYTDFRSQFIYMVEVLSENEELKENGKIVRHISGTTYLFIPFDYEGKKYSQISEEISNGFNIRMRALWCHEDEEIMLILEYLDENGDPKYQWMNDENAPGIELFCVKHATIKTFGILTTAEVEDDEEDDETEYAEYDSSFSLEDFEVQFGDYALPEDLIKLYKFQQEYGSETYSECFGLLIIDNKTGIKTWSEEEEFYNSFIEFAGANGSGSSYAFWLIDNDLNNCPIVVFGDEGGIHVVAENIRKLIHLLTLDTEISVDFDSCYFYKDEEYYEENENKEEFQKWVKTQFNLDALKSNEETEEILNEAKVKYKRKLNEFLTKFDIEIGEEEE